MGRNGWQDQRTARERVASAGAQRGRFAWLAVLTLWGCTSVDSAADRQIAEQRLPRPAAIVVHDFAVAPDEVDPGQPLAGPGWSRTPHGPSARRS